MKYQDFIESVEQGDASEVKDDCLRALWYDANDDWQTAHQIVQSMHGVMAARIHAYLHRKEGDDWNSRYWHGIAGSTFPTHLSLQEEWELLAREMTLD